MGDKGDKAFGKADTHKIRIQWDSRPSGRGLSERRTHHPRKGTMAVKTSESGHRPRRGTMGVKTLGRQTHDPRRVQLESRPSSIGRHTIQDGTMGVKTVGKADTPSKKGYKGSQDPCDTPSKKGHKGSQDPREGGHTI